MAKKKKNSKEVSNLFENIIKASVKGKGTTKPQPKNKTNKKGD